MSLTGQRQEFLDALDTVDEVNAFAYRPAAPKTGDAWPLIQDMERQTALNFDVTWRVVVILPDDERKASDWFEAHHEPIAEALEEAFAYVERIEPGLVATEGGDLQAMFIIVRREA